MPSAIFASPENKMPRSKAGHLLSFSTRANTSSLLFHKWQCVRLPIAEYPSHDVHALGQVLRFEQYCI